MLRHNLAFMFRGVLAFMFRHDLRFTPRCVLAFTFSCVLTFAYIRLPVDWAVHPSDKGSSNCGSFRVLEDGRAVEYKAVITHCVCEQNQDTDETILSTLSSFYRIKMKQLRMNLGGNRLLIAFLRVTWMRWRAWEPESLRADPSSPVFLVSLGPFSVHLSVAWSQFPS